MADWRVLLIVTMLCAAVALTLAFFRRVPEKFSLSCLACCMLFCIACVRLDFFLKYVSHDVLQATTITITRMLICAVSVIFCSASLLFFLCCVSCAVFRRFAQRVKVCARERARAPRRRRRARALPAHARARVGGRGEGGMGMARARACLSSLSLSQSPLPLTLSSSAAGCVWPGASEARPRSFLHASVSAGVLAWRYHDLGAPEGSSSFLGGGRLCKARPRA